MEQIEEIERRKGAEVEEWKQKLQAKEDQLSKLESQMLLKKKMDDNNTLKRSVSSIENQNATD